MASAGGNNNSNSGDNNNTSTSIPSMGGAGSGTLQSLRPNVVDRYWNDIAEHFREPGFSTFDKEKSSMVTRDPEFMRKLLLAVITDRPGQGVLQEDVVKASQQYTDYSRVEPESKALLRAEQLLRHALVPGHNKFFDRVSRLPGGLKFLIDLRQDLINILHVNRGDFYLAALNDSLKEKLQNWFVGFLDLERLTWQSPAVLLEKVTQYEAVHKFKDFHDLKRRVGPGRRVFALMNKSLPTEPLVFVQVALVKSLSNNVQDILNDPSPGHTDPAKTVKCAIFYSITTQVGNTNLGELDESIRNSLSWIMQPIFFVTGLSGIELGNFLIKRVVRSLKVEFPQIETFSTLSPIPGFRKWMGQCQSLGQALLLPQENQIIEKLGQNLLDAPNNTGDSNPEDQFNAILQHPSTFSDSETMGKLRPILSRLCARYLLLEKRRFLALDPVANFHIRNGACVHRLNWLGDTSEKGMDESFGMMVNYLYSLDHIEMNNQQYLQDGTISVSSKDPAFESALAHAPALGQPVDKGGLNDEGQIVQLNGVKLRILDITTA
ncbi:hypothetical protein BGZ49_007746 [Haplosporangium sp. Z 27]|nr:hypothetical protein BGZ49_007746 [Haplosporangium sp. Z 27]